MVLAEFLYAFPVFTLTLPKDFPMASKAEECTIPENSKAADSLQELIRGRNNETKLTA